MSLRFNIIYVKGTAVELYVFLHSLLKWSDCRFRVVANGCNHEEVDLLRNLCQGHPRLEFYQVDGRAYLDHGAVLNHLQAMEDSDYFAFIDSDILATGEFLPPLLEHLQDSAAVFTCRCLSITDREGMLPRSFKIVAGTFQRTEDALCLGSSHCAIYDNRILTQIMDESNVGFDVYHWDELPGEAQRCFLKLDTQRSLYDTGKSLNLLLQSRHERIRFVDVASLNHIGAITGYLLDRKQNRRLSRFDGIFRRISVDRLRVECSVWFTAVQRLRNRIGIAEVWHRARIHRKKDLVACFFLKYLDALRENHPLPPLPFTLDRLLRQKIVAAADRVHALWLETETVGSDRTWRGVGPWQK